MTSIKRVGMVAIALSGVGVFAACTGSSANTPSPAVATTTLAATDDDGASAGLMEYHRYHHHGGVTLLIAMSLDTLGVSPEQRTAVGKIRRDLQAAMEPARVAEQSLEALLADGVAAGNLDAGKVNDALTRLTAEAAALHDACAGALNELHAVLTPDQRAALVDKVEAHWAVWQKANADENAVAANPDGHLSTLATDLDLSSDQVARIRMDLAERMMSVPRPDPQALSTRIVAFGDAFRSETFDARVLTAARRADAELASWGSTHLARLVETAMPVLTAQQRATLAARLREHATHNPSAEESQ